MSKRQKIIIAVLLLVFFQSFVLKQSRGGFFWLLPFFATFLGSWYCLKEDIKGIRYFTILFLPACIGLICALVFKFYTFSNIFKYLLLVFFGILYYVALLANNILNISSLKNIPLSLAARTVNLLLTFVVSFFGFSVVFKLSFPLLGQLFVVFIIAFLLSLQYLWTLDLEERLSSQVRVSALLVSFITTQVSFALTFLPIRVFVRALIVTIPMYLGLGIWTQIKQRRLVKTYIIEFAFVSLISLLVAIIFLK